MTSTITEPVSTPSDGASSISLTATSRQEMSSIPSAYSSAGPGHAETHLILTICLSTILPFLVVIAVLLFIFQNNFRYRTGVLFAPFTRNPLVTSFPRYENERPTTRSSQSNRASNRTSNRTSNMSSDALATYHSAEDRSTLGQLESNAVAHGLREASIPDNEEYRHSPPPPYPGGKI